MFSIDYVALAALILSQAALIIWSACACAGLSRRRQAVIRYMSALSPQAKSEHFIPTFRAKSVTSARVVDHMELSGSSCAIVFVKLDGPHNARDLNDLMTFVAPNVEGSVYVACSGGLVSELVSGVTRVDARVEFLWDENFVLAKAFGVPQYPALVLIGEGGRILEAGVLPHLRLTPKADVDALRRIRQLEREILS